MKLAGRVVLAYDIEVFSNFFLAIFKDGSGRRRQFRETQLPELAEFLHKKVVLVGYNNFGYDDIIMKVIVANPQVITQRLYEISKAIVTSRRLPDKLFKIQYTKQPWAASIDMYQLLNRNGSLKEWECKLQMPDVVESPVDFDAPLDKGRIQDTIDYCDCDVDATMTMLKKYWHLVEVRTALKMEYDLGNRVYVLGDAGLAQAVLTTMHRNVTGETTRDLRDKVNRSRQNQIRTALVGDVVSDRVMFRSILFQGFWHEFRQSTISAKDEYGANWQLEPAWQMPIKLGQLEYQLGVGGLHSVDKPGHFMANDGEVIVDVDVTSYYPSLMIEEELYPQHMGRSFTRHLRQIRDTRVNAKKMAKIEPDSAKAKAYEQTNQALKIVINSAFGKLNDRWSPIRSIQHALTVTLSGQMELLMLIEMIDRAGFEVLSANTDGVMFKGKKDDIDRLLPGIMGAWSKQTGHGLERADYDRYVRRDVNCYLARTVDGKIKAKGGLTTHPLTGKWDGIVIIHAAQQYLMNDVPIEQTIRNHDQPLDFIFYQRVKNGGHLERGMEPIGTVARWYAATQGETIYRRNPSGTRAKVPHGSSSVLAMDIQSWIDLGLPEDLDYDYYIDQAKKLVATTGGTQ